MSAYCANALTLSSVIRTRLFADTVGKCPSRPTL